MQDKTKMTQRELKASIKNDPNLTDLEKAKALQQLESPYEELTDEELLQLGGTSWRRITECRKRRILSTPRY